MTNEQLWSELRSLIDPKSSSISSIVVRDGVSDGIGCGHVT